LLWRGHTLFKKPRYVAAAGFDFSILRLAKASVGD